MRFLSQVPQIDFMRWGQSALMFSLVLVLISVVSLAWQRLNPGIDFSGGILIELNYAEGASLDNIRQVLKEGGFPKARVQNFGTEQDVLIRLAPQQGMNNAQVSDRILRLLTREDERVTLRRVEFIGPQIGDELTQDGGLALLYALFGILLYVAIRFQLRFSVGAVLALAHDVLLLLGFFSMTRMEFDLSVLAAVLAVIGYSLNDTIVIYDRIRENFRRMHKTSAEQVINLSLNQTLNRTLATSLTTLLVLLSLFLLGGETVRGFSLTLILGVLAGTYSSLFVACPLLLKMGVSAVHVLPVELEEKTP